MIKKGSDHHLFEPSNISLYTLQPQNTMTSRKSVIPLSIILPVVLTAFVIPACSETPEEPGRIFYPTDYQTVLYNDDHNSEGFLVPLENGNILLLFRIDPGLEGNHVGTNGYIAQITYDPDKDEWGDPVTVYNSHRFDDRNIHGGITREGRIVIFFRHLGQNGQGRFTEGRYFLYSDDDGQTWSGPHESESWSDPDLPDPRFGVWGTGQMFYNGDIDRYCMLGYGRHITFITCCRDGSSWDEIYLVSEDPEVALTEISGAWAGNNRVIALIRDDARRAGHPLLQVESHDNGITWTDPVPTNIPVEPHWGAAPQLIYDQARDLLIALTSDRYSRDDSENSLFIYSARPDEVLGKPGNWTFEYELSRPWASKTYDGDRPLNQNLYGYPTIAPLNDKEYLVVFTERARVEGTEQADLYYFRLIFDDPY